MKSDHFPQNTVLRWVLVINWESVMDVLLKVFLSCCFVFILLMFYLAINETKFRDAGNIEKIIGIASLYPAALSGFLYVMLWIWS